MCWNGGAPDSLPAMKIASRVPASALVLLIALAANASGATLPAHVITGYWQNFNNGAPVLKLRDVPSAYNLIAVAFAEATATPGAVAFNLDTAATGYSGGAEFIADISLLHSQGRSVILSVGGQDGNVIVNSSAAAANFSSSVLGLISLYGFDGVDIDLENGIDAVHMAQALRSIAAARPGAIITLAPQTIDMQSPGSGYFQLALAIQDVLTIVNLQFYNSGSMNGCDHKVYVQGTEDFLTALACIEIQNGLRPDQVALGLPASPAAAGGGYVDPSVVNAALDCLTAGTHCGSFHPAQTWPGLRGAMTWSINWDAVSGFNWARAVAAHLSSGGGRCIPDTTTLCIDDQSGDARFEIKVRYHTSQAGGLSGDGTAIPLTTLGVVHGGLFWFFSVDNPEMLVKVINACTVNHKFWVFYSAGTNVGLTVTVTDTLTGQTRTYGNLDLKPAAPVQDGQAFDCN